MTYDPHRDGEHAIADATLALTLRKRAERSSWEDVWRLVVAARYGLDLLDLKESHGKREVEGLHIRIGRRQRTPAATSGLSLDRERCEAHVDGVLVKLTAGTAGVLAALMDAGRPVSWQELGSSQSGVSQQVWRLRELLGGDRVLTVRGKGWQLASVRVEVVA